MKELTARTLRSLALDYINQKGLRPPKTLLKAIEELRNRDDIVATKSEKSSRVVVMDKPEYLRLLSKTSINDTSKFRPIDAQSFKARGRPVKYYHPHLQREKQISAVKSKVLPKPIADSIRPKGSRLAHPFEITRGDILVSYDVTSLFTNVPRDETIQILADKAFNDAWLNKTHKLNLSRDQLIDLLNAATKNQLFQFNGNLYEQTDGVAKGSPLGPLLANVFMCSIEDKHDQDGK